MFKYIIKGFEEMMNSIEKGFNETMNVSYPEVERNELELITDYYMGVRQNIRPEMGPGKLGLFLFSILS